MWYLVRRATVVGVLTIHSQHGKGPESDTQICLRTFILNFLGSTLLVFSYSPDNSSFAIGDFSHFAFEVSRAGSTRIADCESCAAGMEAGTSSSIDTGVKL